MANTSAEARAALDNARKLQMIMERFKIRSDLYAYLQDRVGVWLPNYKHCPLEHLQKILRKEIKVFFADNLPKLYQKLPNWDEFSVSTLFEGGFLTSIEIDQYFPSNDPKKIDRRFAWGVFGGLKKDIAQRYYQEIYDAKVKSRLPKAKDQTLEIADEWMDRLLQYETIPSKTSKHTTIHLQFKERKAPKKKEKASKKRTLASFLGQDEQINVNVNPPSEENKKFKANNGSAVSGKNQAKENQQPQNEKPNDEAPAPKVLNPFAQLKGGLLNGN